MAGKEMSEEERAAFGQKMRDARAARRQERDAMGPISGGSEEDGETEEAVEGGEETPLLLEAPTPTYKRVEALDAAALAAPDPTVFDPNGVYVVMDSAIGMPYGEEGEWQQPVFHGDYIAAQAADGVRGLAASELRSPADNARIGQKATDGVDKLRQLWERGSIAHPSHPHALEARRNRIHADEIVAAHSADRLGDPRLNIIANGGRVAEYAYGEKVG